MDKLTPQQRHINMAAIRSKDTKPEMIARRGMWKRGFRYRLNHKRLPGHPDLVLRKYRTCIFVNGCFWHGHHVNLQFLEVSSVPLGRADELPLGRDASHLKNLQFLTRSVARYRRRTGSFGWQRFAGTRSGIRRNSVNWRKWADIASQFGNVS